MEMTSKATAHGITTGRWDVGLLGCFTHCVPNCLMVSCFPFVSMAQIAQRMGILRYSVALVTLLALYVLEIAMTAVAVANIVDSVTTIVDEVDSIRKDRDNRHYKEHIDAGVSSGMSLGAAAIAYSLGSLSALVYFIAVWQLRTKIRDRFEIPGSCCGDYCAVLCCQCCTIAQMATHVKSYAPGSCDFGPPDTLPAYL